MLTVLLVIAVSNGNPYRETPVYVIEYPTEAACQVAAGQYPTVGLEFKKAVCLPKVKN